MRCAFFIALLLFSPIVVAAKNSLPRIDWFAVFSQNAQEIETKILDGGEVVEELKLPDGAVVQRRQTSDGIAYDVQFQTSGDNADQAACLFTSYLYHMAQLERCPVYLANEQGQTISQRLARIAKFVGDNSVPPVTGGALTQAIEARKSEVRGLLQPPECGYLGGEPSAYYAGKEAGAEISEALYAPRLPLMGNCL